MWIWLWVAASYTVVGIVVSAIPWLYSYLQGGKMAAADVWRLLLAWPYYVWRVLSGR